jgi:hypothetical protein
MHAWPTHNFPGPEASKAGRHLWLKKRAMLPLLVASMLTRRQASPDGSTSLTTCTVFVIRRATRGSMHDAQFSLLSKNSVKLLHPVDAHALRLPVFSCLAYQ